MICKNKIVTLHYHLKDNEGNTIENSFEQEPMVYLHGAQNIIHGLEQELEGKTNGDTFTVEVKSQDAYGEHLDYLCQTVPRSSFQDVDDIIPGMRFTAETETGPHPVQVIHVDDENIVVDGNHPLAGMDLVFIIEVLDIREATEDEISHGHPHQNDSDCSNALH
jgi:FKBP-type peptidyl-prolyl cis-trans isomerase SlyD